MSEKGNKPVSGCDAKTASTLAASSLIRFFQKKHWKIVSFFPNSPCARHAPRKQDEESKDH